MKKSEFIQLIREEIKRVLKEYNKSIDSHYLQKSLDTLIDDTKRDEPNINKLLKYLKSRINQSYPSGDVERKDIDDILKDPRARSIVKQAGKESEYYIDSLFENKMKLRDLLKESIDPSLVSTVMKKVGKKMGKRGEYLYDSNNGDFTLLYGPRTHFKIPQMFIGLSITYKGNIAYADKQLKEIGLPPLAKFIKDFDVVTKSQSSGNNLIILKIDK